MARQKRSLTDELGWLQWLKGEIMELVTTSGGSYDGMKWLSQKRSLTKPELNRVLRIVVTHKLPLAFVYASFGFGVVIYNSPPFPGIEIPQVFHFESRQFPAESSESKDVHQKACEFLWPYFTSPENIEMLKLYNLDLPKDNMEPYYSY